MVMLKQRLLRGAMIAGLVGWALAGARCSTPPAHGQTQPSDQREPGETAGPTKSAEAPESRPPATEQGGEEEEVSDLEKTIPELTAEKCEHEVYTYHCDECRYEVGVVKVDAKMVNQPEAKEAGLITVEPATAARSGGVLVVTGEVSWNENAAVHLSAPAPGRVAAVHVDLGDRVKKGDPLFELRSDELAEIAAAYQGATQQAALADKNYRREKELRDRRISSEQELVEAEAALRSSQAEANAAQRRLVALGLTAEDLASPRLRTEGLITVRAPIDGTVVEKHLGLDEAVEPGGELVFLADLSALWVWADIHEQDLATLIETKNRREVKAEVRLLSFQDRVFPGTLDYIGSSMDKNARTVKARLQVKNGDGLLRPGMFCEVRFPDLETRETVLVPEAAVLSDEGVDFVFKHLKDDYWVRRKVVVGRSYDGKIEVLSGLAPGEVIATEGAFLLKSDVLRSKMGAGCAD